MPAQTHEYLKSCLAREVLALIERLKGKRRTKIEF